MKRDGSVVTGWWPTFVERYFYEPSFFQKVVSFLLLPISLVYYCVATFILKRCVSRERDLGAKIISVGNIVSGGSGKTPFSISLIHELKKKGVSQICFISRGYKREGNGLVLVSSKGEMHVDVRKSGDEAYLVSEKVCCFADVGVIVCADRAEAILKAKSMGYKVMILDDGYRFNFRKFDILLKPKENPYFNFTLPSGYYRFPTRYYKRCDMLAEEGICYIRKVSIVNPTDKMILVTAIAQPSRLERYLDKRVIKKVFYMDHASFSEKELVELSEKYNSTSILVTGKDYVKCRGFNIRFSILDLNIEIREEYVDMVKRFIAEK